MRLAGSKGWGHRVVAAGAAAWALGALSNSATAHPHVWVAVETTVVYDKGAISGFRHRWSFDELYTTMAIQGLDANGDGAYDKAELAELAKVNMDGLKEFDYFTQARLGGQPLKLAQPKESWLEYKDGVLSLNFVLPLDQPVLADADGFSFSVSDPSYFIAFDLAKDKPVRLSEGAPAGCQANVVVAEQDKAELERLGRAFQQELGGASMAIGAQKSIAVSCPRS
jgi:ABC-type uncharacterized transport system substrate-binding protein